MSNFKNSTAFAVFALILLLLNLMDGSAKVPLALVANAQQSARPSANAGTCTVTRPPDPPFVPPAPYPRAPGPGYFWFGTRKLWTFHPVAGKWRWAPHRPGHENDLTQKIPWWRAGLPQRVNGPPPFVFTGKRLDGPAPDVRVEGASPSYTKNWKHFLMMGVFVPASGCWEFTGDYYGDKLSFVIRVGN